MYTEFDKRMKGYERQFNVALDPYEPVIVRVDGRCFHTFTKNFQKPFDDVLSRTMRDTMQYLCENVQGCVLGYTQSDEISLLLANYLNERAEPFFGYRIQKLCSVIAWQLRLSWIDMKRMWKITKMNLMNFLNDIININMSHLIAEYLIFLKKKLRIIFTGGNLMLLGMQ